MVCSFSLFAQRKPNVNQDWQRKLPDFVRRLEEALYRAARSPVSSRPSCSNRQCWPGLDYSGVSPLDAPDGVRCRDCVGMYTPPL